MCRGSAYDESECCRAAGGGPENMRRRNAHRLRRGGVLMVFLLIIGAIGIATFGAAIGAVFTLIYFSKGLPV